jgi:hypothetical protein
LLAVKCLLALVSTAILGSEFHGIHDFILLSDDYGSPQTQCKDTAYTLAYTIDLDNVTSETKSTVAMWTAVDC